MLITRSCDCAGVAKPAVGACGRDRGVTILVRVDVSSGSAGVLAVTLSHQAAGFAP